MSPAKREEFFRRLAAAMPEPIAVPSSTSPIFTRSRFFRSQS